MKNMEWLVQKHISAYELVNDDKFLNMLGEKCVGIFDLNAAFIKWLDAEHEEKPVLDDAEKQYLSAVIKPFRKYVISLRLQDVGVTSNQRVTVFYNDYVFGRSSFALPTFKQGTMYKGMEVGRRYTLDELGL